MCYNQQLEQFTWHVLIKLTNIWKLHVRNYWLNNNASISVFFLKDDSSCMMNTWKFVLTFSRNRSDCINRFYMRWMKISGNVRLSKFVKMDLFIVQKLTNFWKPLCVSYSLYANRFGSVNFKNVLKSTKFKVCFCTPKNYTLYVHIFKTF